MIEPAGLREDVYDAVDKGVDEAETGYFHATGSLCIERHLSELGTVLGQFLRQIVFPSLDQRPMRTLSAPVRPPNGCYDVTVELRPRAIGILNDGDQQYAAVGRSGDALSWAVTRIVAVARSVQGPLSGPPAC